MTTDTATSDDAPQPAPKTKRSTTNQSAFTRAASTPHQHGSITTPVNTAMLTLGTGGTVHVLDLAPAYPAIMTAIGTVSGALAAHQHMRADPHVTTDSKLPRRAARYAATCLACAGSWITWAALDSPYTPAALATLAAGLIALGPSYSNLRSSKRRTIAARETEIAEKKHTSEQERQQRQTHADWTAILATADKRLANVEILDRTDWEPEDDPLGFTLTCEIQPHEGSGAAITQDDLRSLGTAITTAARHRLKPQGVKIAAGACQPEPDEEDAALFRLHVQLKNPLAGILDPPGMGQPSDAGQGLDVGRFKDGLRILLELVGKHTEIVGGTRSGKSALLMSIFLQLMRCDNAVIWIGGTAKLMPLITPLCLPWWRGETDSPPVDYIAGQSHDEVMKQLFDLLCLIEDRTQIPKLDEQRTPTADMPIVFAVIEESPHLLENGEKYQHPRTGKRYSASEALAEVHALGGSELVHAVRLGQYALYGSGGEAGTKMKRNTANRVLLWTQADQDASSVLGPLGNRIKASEIKNNTMYAVLGDNARLMQGKSYYGGKTEDIARLVRTNHGLQSDLDEPSTRNLPYYADRWSRERQAEIIAHKNNTLVAFGAASADDLTPAPDATTTNTAPLNGPAPTYPDTTGDNGGKFGPAPDLQASMREALRKQGVDPDEYLNPGENDTTSDDTNTPEPATEKPPAETDDEFFRLVGDLDKLPTTEEVEYPTSTSETTPEESTAPYPLGAILNHYAGSDRTFLSVKECATALEMDASRLGALMASEPIAIQSQRRRSPDHDGTPTAGWKLADLQRRARELDT
ncbi:hypothetical protein FHX42_005283 [Saccharopolyspora lacisalsi]|uniref:FtsK domain-containing protein n=1 Tax=Halosaccharopolyspora lacisalsi TaxID=1000566 RepID=A0A839E5H0_9PSEU|nr:hypothetical protein [Halosaccharopolyspora lacisalsi]MBA8827876.1 hypothetical protein [Halosaccharopolyspora lacisalsi]